MVTTVPANINFLYMALPNLGNGQTAVYVSYMYAGKSLFNQQSSNLSEHEHSAFNGNYGAQTVLASLFMFLFDSRYLEKELAPTRQGLVTLSSKTTPLVQL